MRRFTRLLRKTPLHPQWLLADIGEKATTDLTQLRGIVLDVGCADRWVSKMLSSECTYVGLDYPATGATLYRARPEVFGDASVLPFANACFDAVTFLEVMEHLRHPQEALREAARVLKPGGTLLLSMPFLYPIHDAPYDFQRFTKYGLERELKNVGLILRRLDRVGGALETAGLLVCLALAGGVVEALKARSYRLLWAPIILALIPVVNIVTALSKEIFPQWQGMSQGHWLVAQKSSKTCDSIDGVTSANS